MKNDEFNKIEIKNDGKSSLREFGKTQKFEFSHQKDNTLPKGDLNEKYTEKKSKKTADIDIDKISKAANGSVNSTATTTSVQGATTASSAAAATSSAVTIVASTVAIAAAGVATGISFSAPHDYDYHFNSLLVTSNAIRYDLALQDKTITEDFQSYEDVEQSDIADEKKEEKAPFILRLYNANYEAAQNVWYSDSNVGSFEHLEEGQKYNIVLMENVDGGMQIYKDTITTYANSKFLDFDFTGKCDMKEGTFSVSMNFVDDNNSFDNFTLTLKSASLASDNGVSFALEKINGSQAVSNKLNDGGTIFDWNDEYEYTFSYNNEGSRVEYKTGTVKFTDISGSKSVFNGFYLNKEANFKTREMEVQLDYVDDFGWYENFVLVMTIHFPGDETGGEYTDEREIYLEKTTEVQTINVMEYEIMFEEDFTYTYVLYGTFKGNEVELAREDTPFVFTDTSGAKSEFNKLIFTKEANFITHEIQLQLDYVDDFYWFDGFVFTLTYHVTYDDSPIDYTEDLTFDLDSTTEVQTINLTEYEVMFTENYKYTYSLSAYYRGERTVLAEEKTEFVFTDNSGGKSEWNKFIFTKEADFLEYTFDVQLDFQDDYGYYWNFELFLYPNGVNATYRFMLEKTTEVQTLSCDREKYGFFDFSFDYTFSYELKVYYIGESMTVDSGEDFTFTDISNGVSEFKELIFDGSYTLATRLARVQLDFQDDYGYFSEFCLHIYNSEDLDYPSDIYLEKTTEVQTFSLDEYDISTDETQYYYSLTATFKGQEIELVEMTGMFEFHDPDANSNIDLITIVNNEANFLERYFYVQIDYVDDYQIYESFELYIEDASTGRSKYYSLEKTTEPQKVTIDEVENGNVYPIDIVAHTIYYNLRYTRNDEDETQNLHMLYATNQSTLLNNSLHSEFYGIETPFDFCNSNGQYQMPFKFDFIDEAQIYSDIEMQIYDGETSLASISFQNEVVKYEWQYGSFSSSEYSPADIAARGELDFYIRGKVRNERTDEVTSDILYQDKVTFTVNKAMDVYGISLSDYVGYGSWETGFELMYCGQEANFADFEIIIEPNDSDKTYTYDFSLSPLVYITLSNPKEDNFEEEVFEQECESTFKISIRFCKVIPNIGVGFRANGDGEKSDPITIVCYEDFKFFVGH